VVQRLAELDVLENVPGLVKRADGDWQRVREELGRSLESWTGELHTLSQIDAEMGVALDRFQEQALALRARPAAEILAPLQRLVQDMARHQGKLVKLELAGEGVELDVGALDVLSDPVRRLVWFAVTHSIENPVQRQEAGKPAVGRVSVRMRKTANHVRVVIEDDGRGVDPQAVRDRGDVEASDLSAVSAMLQAHRGRLSMAGEPGEGTRFSLELPLDTVVIDGMVVRAGGVHYVVPVGAIQRIVKPDKRQVVRSSADGNRSVLQLGEALVPIQTLVGDTVSHVPNEGLLLVIEGGERGAALVVDELIGQQQVLIQPLQGYMADVPGVSGYALLGEGDVGMVLDLSRVDDWLGPEAAASTYY
jgi:two-component system chemotaxis sensor kinase CheA